MAKLITLEVLVKVEDAASIHLVENYMYAAAEKAMEAMEKDTYEVSLVECEALSDRHIDD